MLAVTPFCLQCDKGASTLLGTQQGSPQALSPCYLQTGREEPELGKRECRVLCLRQPDCTETVSQDMQLTIMHEGTNHTILVSSQEEALYIRTPRGPSCKGYLDI